MKRDPLLLIDDMLESIALIQQYTDSATKKTFLNDRLRGLAGEHEIE